jgi:hypothetical protein
MPRGRVDDDARRHNFARVATFDGVNRTENQVPNECPRFHLPPLSKVAVPAAPCRV